MSIWKHLGNYQRTTHKNDCENHRNSNNNCSVNKEKD